jgi:hypothetical protein
MYLYVQLEYYYHKQTNRVFGQLRSTTRRVPGLSRVSQSGRSEVGGEQTARERGCVGNEREEYFKCQCGIAYDVTL